MANPSMLLLFVDQRITYSSSFGAYKSLNRKYRRILTNPSPTSAYAINRSAIDTLDSISEIELRGFQADFPLNWFHLIRYYALESSKNCVSLVPSESLILNRDSIREISENVLTRILKTFLPKNLRNAQSFGVSRLAYFGHFLGRPLAWHTSKLRKM
jgi:hypothetical protein